MLWHNKEMDEKGSKLEDHISEHDLIILSKSGNPPTYKEGAQASSNIDIAIASSDLANKLLNWKVSDASTCSEHNSIVFGLEEQTNKSTEERNYIQLTYNLKINDKLENI